MKVKIIAIFLKQINQILKYYYFRQQINYLFDANMTNRPFVYKPAFLTSQDYNKG
jgi:hypothetical protein